ncbi:MAG: class I SAM-dependent methyltransferase [Chloroflexota bacterium]|nr:MAG: class I SAM-dependent methyltransferase [Chloroflexota bacterium]
MEDQLDYYTFMGYSSEALTDRYRPYAGRFDAGSRVLDIGCGRGEFLGLLAARGVAGVGVDADASMVAECASRGLDAHQADGLEFMGRHRGEFDGVFASHLVEHLPPAQVDQLVHAAHAALRDGGRLILVTPNPANLQMQLRDFWIDLQHVRLYSPEIIAWLLHGAGFTGVEEGVNPRYESHGEVNPLGLEPVPSPLPPPRPVGRERLAGVMPPSVGHRLGELEARVNLLTRWAQSLYPPAEYWVSGIR